MKKSNHIKIFLSVLTVFVLLWSSCSKQMDEVGQDQGEAKVRIKISGVTTGDGNDESPTLKQSAFTTVNSVALGVQSVDIPFNDEYVVRATLSPVLPDQQQLRASGSNRAEATQTGTETQPLADGTKYVVAVYDNTGAYVDHEEYTHTTGSGTVMLSLDPGEYTFVAIASSSNTLPTVDYTANLSAINLEELDADVDLIYQKQIRTITAGDNDLELLLKHLFTQVIVTLNSVAEIGDITDIAGGTVAPHHESVNISLEDGSLTINGTAGQRGFTFPSSASGLSWTSEPVMILTETTTSGTVVLNDVTINGSTKTLTVNGLNIRSGVKYTLGLDLKPADGEGLVMDIDGNVYTTVVIGDLEWMVENLKVTRYKNGDPIPTGLSNADWADTYNNGSLGAYAVYPYTETDGLVSSENEMIETYGLLYNGFAVHDARGLAPEGWRVPTDEDFKALELAAGLPEASLDNTGWRGSQAESSQLSLKLRSTIGWNGTEVGNLGFEALPAGRRPADGNYTNFANAGNTAVAAFWTSTNTPGATATTGYRRLLQQNYTHGINRVSAAKRDGFSVRCVRDR